MIKRVDDGGLAESYLFGHMFDRLFLSLTITHPVISALPWRQLVISPTAAGRFVHIWVIMNVHYYIPAV